MANPYPPGSLAWHFEELAAVIRKTKADLLGWLDSLLRKGH